MVKFSFHLYNECNKLRSMTGLHLRLGDRGTALTDSELQP